MKFKSIFQAQHLSLFIALLLGVVMAMLLFFLARDLFDPLNQHFFKSTSSSFQS